MRVTNESPENIDFEWTGLSKIPVAKRIPYGFLRAYFNALREGREYADYVSPGGNRFVGKISEKGHLDVIVNPKPEMCKKPKHRQRSRQRP